MADANMYIYEDGRIQFAIKIKDSDHEHLEKFKKSINSNHPILTYVSAFNTKISRIIIYEQNLIYMKRKK